MKRFMVVSVMIPSTAWRIIVFAGFPPFSVRAYTISGHVGAKLAAIPAVRALLTGGVVGVD